MSDQVSAVEKRLGIRLPDRLRSLYAVTDGVFRQDGQWWVVWPLSRLGEENEQMWSDARLSRGLLAFGDDGTGDPFCVRIEGNDDEVIRWSHIDGAPVGSEGSIAEFLSYWLALE